MNTTLSAAAALGVVIVLAPGVIGVAARTRAALTHRRGTPVLQLYFDLFKLLRRGAVFSDATTWVFRFAPVAVVVTAILAALVVPLDGRASLFRFAGDPVALAYTFAFGRFFLVLAALDTGSSFEGMGASREVTFASLVEVGLFLSFATLAVLTHELSLSGMLEAPLARASASGSAPAVAMIAGSFFALLLAECARVPVDDPATHLELTMIHEVMVLDHSGPDLALILYAGALKLSVLGAVVISVLVPRANLPPAVAIAVLAGGLLLVGVGVGIVEASMARLRLPKVPLYLAGASALALFSLILALWSAA
ncbi:MAG: NADH-quinone oxidoreductase subunit H [Gemmatimonadaceae bacterium]|nr:NADH-quinone oxidoreductase subunit H [Gemmatimonadaceae bacterium]